MRQGYLYCFSPNSYLAASMSKVRNTEVNIDNILKQSCWKNTKKSFIYYDQVITEYSADTADFSRIYRAKKSCEV